MPSPIGHEMAGIIVFDALRWVSRTAMRTRALVLCLVVAVLPDFDFLFGIIEGEPNRYHHGLSHSLAVGLVVSIVLAAVFSSENRFWMITCLLFFVYAGHLVLDLLSSDSSHPYGLQLLWPFSSEYLISPKKIFLDIRRENSSTEFVQSLLSNAHNYRAVLWEAVLLAPPLVALRILANRRVGGEWRE